MTTVPAGIDHVAIHDRFRRPLCSDCRQWQTVLRAPASLAKAVSDDFVKAIRATGRKTLIMAGVWTSVCVMFPALDAKAAGYKVYAVVDASGDPSEMASRVSVARFAQAGVIPTSTNSVLSETHRTWNRPEAAELAKLYGLVAPNYAAVMESYGKAQAAALKK